MPLVTTVHCSLLREQQQHQQVLRLIIIVIVEVSLIEILFNLVMRFTPLHHQHHRLQTEDDQVKDTEIRRMKMNFQRTMEVAEEFITEKEPELTIIIIIIVIVVHRRKIDMRRRQFPLHHRELLVVLYKIMIVTEQTQWRMGLV